MKNICQKHLVRSLKGCHSFFNKKTFAGNEYIFLVDVHYENYNNLHL